MVLDDSTFEPDEGVSIKGLLTTAEVIEAAKESFRELNAQCDVSDPWLVDATQLCAIEEVLPIEKVPLDALP